jgi:pyrroline-5-carboxylate reductase
MTEKVSTVINQFPAPLLLFGCGNMSGAMVKGWTAAGIAPSSFHIVKPSQNNLPDSAVYFPNAAAALTASPQQYETLIIGVKPQILHSVADDIRSLIAPGGLIISLLGGVNIDSLAQLFPDARILRAMPNLAVALGQSPIGLFAANWNAPEMTDTERWFYPLGSVYWMEAENDMHAFTALAGCGPAFLFNFIAALSDAGEKLGISPEQSAQIAKQMILGAASLANNSDEAPAALSARVASKGGSTAAGLSVLDENDNLQKLMAKTLKASHDRSRGQEREVAQAAIPIDGKG